MWRLITINAFIAFVVVSLPVFIQMLSSAQEEKRKRKIYLRKCPRCGAKDQEMKAPCTGCGFDLPNHFGYELLKKINDDNESIINEKNALRKEKESLRNKRQAESIDRFKANSLNYIKANSRHIALSISFTIMFVGFIILSFNSQFEDNKNTLLIPVIAFGSFIFSFMISKQLFSVKK